MTLFNTTIYGSGGAGTELVVPAIGSAQTAEVNTKVLLVYANEVGGTDIPVTNSIRTGVNSDTQARTYGSDFNALHWSSQYKGRNAPTSSNNCTLTSLSASWVIEQGQYQYSSWDIDPVVGKKADFYWDDRSAIGFGGSADTFVDKTGRVYGEALYGVKGSFVINSFTPSVYVYSEKDNTMASVPSPDQYAYWRMPILYNDDIYVLCLLYNKAYKVNRLTGAIIETITVEGPTQIIASYGIGYALTPSGDYFLTWSNVGDVWLNKLTKGTTWSYERLENLPVSQEGFVLLIRAKEDRNSIHIYIVPSVCTDIDNVKHYIVDKATGAVSRGPDLLDTRGYNKIMAAAFDMEKSRASFVLANSTTNDLKCVVSGLDTVLPYEYAAVPFNSANLTDSAVTGFIKSQDGTDELGNPIATVEALLDPNAMPPSADRLIGMNVTVNEGDPL